jgi:RNA polymerase sigma-B factor
MPVTARHGDDRRPALSALQERRLFERHADRHGERDRERLVERYLPLARHLAQSYAGRDEPFDDLLQVACLGLFKAVDRFDPARDVAFSSFAVPTIVGELKRHFRDRTWAVRPPRGLIEVALRVDRTVRDLHSQTGRQPTVVEVAGALGVAVEEVLEAMEASTAYHAMSLQTPRRRDGEHEHTLGDVIGTADDGFERAQQRATLAALLKHVTAREREVLRLRFEDDLTQQQIGERIGVSQMQVSRILRHSLARLRLIAARVP